jgi:Glyoxalase-like domain
MARAHRSGKSRKASTMALSFQLVIDCRDADRLARFWAAALDYRLEPAPEGFASWDDYYRDLGVPEEELGLGADRIGDPEGHGPVIWFQVVPEAKTIKNRLHLDIHAGGGRSVPIQIRRERVDAAARRLVELGATLAAEVPSEGLDHYAVGMRDPEGNEFDIN